MSRTITTKRRDGSYETRHLNTAESLLSEMGEMFRFIGLLLKLVWMLIVLLGTVCLAVYRGTRRGCGFLAGRTRRPHASGSTTGSKPRT